MTQDSIDAAGFREACRHAGRLAEALGLGDYGHSIGEIVDTAIDRLAARADATQQAGVHSVLHDLWLRVHLRRFDGNDYDDEPRPDYVSEQRAVDSFYAGVLKSQHIIEEVAREQGIDRVYDHVDHPLAAPAREADPAPAVADDVREAAVRERVLGLADEWSAAGVRYKRYAVGSSIPDELTAIGNTLLSNAHDLRAAVEGGTPSEAGDTDA